MGAVESANCCRVSRPSPDPDLALLAPHAHPEETGTLSIVIASVTGIPRRHEMIEKIHAAKTGMFVEVWIELKDSSERRMLHRTRTQMPTLDGTIEFQDESMSVSAQRVSQVWFSVWISYMETMLSSGFSRLLGQSPLPCDELAASPESTAWMFDAYDLLVYDPASYQAQPLAINVKVPRAATPATSPAGAASSPLPAANKPRPVSSCAKHVMVITRGTRGDVQPFLAVARGMCEMHNWGFTFVTEMRYRELVLKNSNVKAGAIEFRPSGGDTEARIDQPIAKWFLNQQNRTLQMLMLARAEREFFDSEPAFYYWSEKLKPDAIFFGFSTANLAMIISEALKIPVVGFILQPTVIPSVQYPAIVPIGRRADMRSRTSVDNLSRLRQSQESLQHLGAPASTSPDRPGSVSAPSPRKTSWASDLEPPSSASKYEGGRDDGEEEGGGEEEEDDVDDDEGEEEGDLSSSDIDTTLGAASNGGEEPASYMDALFGETWDLSLATTSTVFSGSGSSSSPRLAESDPSHAVYGLLKNIAENNFFTGRINVMRASHKLPPIKNRETDFETLTKQDVPLIVPINAVAFGGRPPDWGPSLVMTDFVHLSPSIPAGTDGIDLLQPALKAFILQAKADGKPICAVAFSSMPVGRTAVLGLSTLVAEKSRHGARVIAIVGTRPKNEVTDVSMEKRAGKLAAAKRIIEIAGAPFGVLFPLCDFVVVHGGLGTTSEAFRAGKPLLVTGIMVFDQRFWGRRVSALGVGPNPVHIRRLPRVLVDIVDKALTPGNEWAQNAKVLQKIIAEGHHGDGVQFTVDALVDAVEHRAKVVNRSS